MFDGFDLFMYQAFEFELIVYDINSAKWITIY